MKRTASLRFAALAPQRVTRKEAIDRLFVCLSHRQQSERSESQRKHTRDREILRQKEADSQKQPEADINAKSRALAQRKKEEGKRYI